MARPRTPTKVLDARGAFRKHPERKRDREPSVTTPLGAPPESLTKQESAAWHEIAVGAPTSVLTESDRLSVELAARLLVESRTDWVNFTAAKLARLQSLLATFGMTPSDRAKLSIGCHQPDDNPFSAFDE